MKKLIIGCHLSATLGYKGMINTALKIGASTFQFFTRNPQGGSKAKPLDLDDINAYNEISKINNFGPIVAHAPYTMNLAGLDSTREFGIRIMKEDLERLNYVDNVYYNFHPGSHVSFSEEEGINRIIDALNECVDSKDGVLVLLETMAGKGTEIGRNFYQIKKILENVNYPNRFGVTLDTCHVFDSGYDIRDSLKEVIDEFDRVIGLDKLKAIHLNDSKNELGSRKDRHEVLGGGKITLRALIDLVKYEPLHDLPFILETHQDL